MVTVVVGMLLALLLAVGVVALVAIPACREGREVLTPQGEQLMSSARDRVFEAREKVVDLGQKLPTTLRSGDGDGDGASPAAAAPAAEADLDLRDLRSQDSRRSE